MRIVAFVMRAVLARVDSAGRNFDLVLAQQIIYGAGFFGVLYAAFIIVLDRYDHRITPTPETLTSRRSIVELSRGQIPRSCHGSPETGPLYDSL